MRDTTNKILEMIDEGLLDARTVASACLKYMSEDDVEEMASMNEFLEDEHEDEEDDDESYPYIINVGMRKDDLQPYIAAPSHEQGLIRAETALQFYNYSEVVYMPEDDLDTNEVVWRSWED